VQVDAQLLIRPGTNDHQIVGDLLSPGGSSASLPSGRPIISRLVVDAHVALQRPVLREIAAGAGIAYWVDPITHLFQGELRSNDRWALLPFGRAKALDTKDLSSATARNELVQAVVDYELEAGATAVIPPYLYASDPEDPWFEISLDLLGRTATFMNRSGVRLPILPVLCGQLQGFGPDKSWLKGVDRFIQVALSIEASGVGLCLSPAGAANDSYNKVMRLFRTAERMTESTLPVFAWRQGIYGLGLVAAGLSGYETGIATSEQCNIAGGISSRRPAPNGKRRAGGASSGIYLEPFGRSLPTSVAQALLGDLRMRAKVMCDDERCCPMGATSTIDQHREHAIRARARGLAALDEMPQRSWRLHRVARDARTGATLIAQSNKILRDVGLKTRLNEKSANALAQVAEYLSQTAIDGSQ
jgi:hypothetical protein